MNIIKIFFMRLAAKYWVCNYASDNIVITWRNHTQSPDI